MKYGIHLSTYCKNWFEDLTEHIILSKKIGYDGVEFPLLDPFAFDLKKYVTITRAEGIQGLCSTGLNPTADISSIHEKIRNSGIDHLKKCVDIAHELESPYVTGVTYSPWGFTQSKLDGRENINHLVTSLRSVSDYAKQADVSIYLEVINRFESYVVNTLQEGVDLLKIIDSDNVGLHFDTFHAHIEEKNIYQALIQANEFVKHVHFSENDRGLPLTGQVNWKQVAKGLKEINYNDWICLESFVMTECEVGDGSMVWRNIDQGGEHVATQGLKNMRRILNEETQ